MPTGFFKRYRDAWVPADNDSRAALRRAKEGPNYRLEWHTSRSKEQHDMIWALTRLAADNHPTLKTAEAVMAWAKVRLGHCTEVKMPGGAVAYIPNSIAFDNMPQDEYQPFSDALIALYAGELGVTPESLREAASPIPLKGEREYQAG